MLFIPPILNSQGSNSRHRRRQGKRKITKVVPRTEQPYEKVSLSTRSHETIEKINPTEAQEIVKRTIVLIKGRKGQRKT